MDGTVSLNFIIGLLGFFGLAAATGAFIWYYRQTGGQKAQALALADYKSLAESRQAKVEERDAEIATLREALKTRTVERDTAVSDRNDCAQENLRLWARLGALERAFNSLERRFELPETDFNDPARLHRTDSPERNR